MASVVDLETLRCKALEEQITANGERRLPNNKMLDGLGSLVLPDFSPVMCHTPYAYYVDLTQSEAESPAVRQETEGAVSGRFGGFLTQNVAIDFDEDGIVSSAKVGFLILDSPKKLTGYVCPVEITKLQDSLAVIQEESLFLDLEQALTEEVIDIKKLNEHVAKLVKSDPKHDHYEAYIKSMLAPSDVFSSILYEGQAVRVQDTKQWYYHEQQISSMIDKTDTFAFGAIGIRSHDVVPRQLMIKRGQNGCIFIPTKAIIGHTLPDRIQNGLA